MSGKLVNVADNQPDEDFEECWVLSGNHFLKQVDKGQLKVFRTTLLSPIIEHHVFRLGNQLFIVFIKDVQERLTSPSSWERFIEYSATMNAIPCVVEMRKSMLGGWQFVNRRWGLTHAMTGKEVYPPELVTHEKIEMSDWEVQDFAIQVLMHGLEKNGYEITSHHSYPEIKPSVWLIDPDGQLCYLVISVVRYPQTEAPIPDGIAEVVEANKNLSEFGYYLSISVANSNEAFDPDAEIGMKLYRGDGLMVSANDPVEIQTIMRKH